MLGQQFEAGRQSAAVFASVEQRLVERRQPATGVLQRALKSGSLGQAPGDDPERLAKGTGRRSPLLDLDGLGQTDARGGQLAELLVEFGTVGKLPGGGEHGVSPAARRF